MTDTTGILAVLSTPTEIVLSERVTTSEFKVAEMYENVANRTVRAEIELGPFVSTNNPSDPTETRGSSRRSIVVWQGAEYDAVRDSWNNLDLLARLPSLL